MLNKLLLWLDAHLWPQKLVSWVLRRRARSRLSRYLFPHTAATNAVSLAVSSPLKAPKDLFLGVVPATFGSWRDYRVLQTMASRNIAVALLRETRSDVEFTLVMPAHAGFKRREFFEVRTLRLTCEAERSALYSVRHLDGRLIAAGTLELIPRAAFSKEVTT